MSQTPVGIDSAGLVEVAAAILTDLEPRFAEGVGAPSAVDKGGNDFATEFDLELERTIVERLTAETGIAVHGEEFGGPDPMLGTMWVVDPIDGTFNYSAGVPLSGTLIGLLHDGKPLAGLTWLPLTNQRYRATVDGPVFCNDEPMPRRTEVTLEDSVIAFGAFNVASRGRYPGAWRMAILGEVSRRVSRLRLLGSTGIDMAWCAAGHFGGAVCFGHHPWDNAAGAALVIAAGGVVTDLSGQSWTAASPSMLAGSPAVHAELLDIVAEIGAPEEFR